MKYDLNKDLIEGLHDSTNQEYVDKLNNLVYALVGDVIASLSDKSSFIQEDKVVLVPANELYLQALCSQSEYTYFLGVSNKEIELNSTDKKHFFKNLWKRFKRAWRVTRRKRKKKKKDDEMYDVESTNITKYNIDDLRHDIIFYLSNKVTATSVIYDYEDYISIIGKEDFGSNVKINIYVCMYDDKAEVFKMYNYRKNKFFDVDFNERFRNLDAKVGRCGQSFINLVQVYNSLYAKAYNKVPNQILIESLLFACPDILFTDDLYQTFINVSNYIRMTDVSSIRSICNNDKSIFQEKLITLKSAQIDFSKLIKLLDRYKV